LHVIIEADGGSRGNPGPAGFGAVVRDFDTGEVLREVAAGIGIASNNVAEYRGLIAGLEAAAELGAREVDVRMDSLLVVNQMSQKWQIKHEAMRPLASAAAALVRRFDAVRFTHIRRELNKHADRLANEAMDAAARGLEWSGPSLPDSSAGAEAPRLGWSAPTGVPTTLLLVRHGETALSAEKRFSGRGDPELTERGVEQARAVAARLASYDVTAVVSSPLRRAARTAEIVGEVLGVEVGIDDGLIETDFGAWEGLTFGEAQSQWPDAMQAWLADPAFAPPGGESFASVFTRLAETRERLTRDHPAGRVVVVSHVTPIKAMVRDALGAPAQVLFRMNLDLASLTTVDWYADGPGVLTGFNDVSHLR